MMIAGTRRHVPRVSVAVSLRVRCGSLAVFQNAGEFNQDIGGWDTTSVTNMSNSARPLALSRGLWLARPEQQGPQARVDMARLAPRCLPVAVAVFRNAHSFNAQSFNRGWNTAAVTTMANSEQPHPRSFGLSVPNPSRKDRGHASTLCHTARVLYGSSQCLKTPMRSIKPSVPGTRPQ